MDDLHCYSIENVRVQAGRAKESAGFFTLRFYAAGGKPSREKTDALETFYYYPSGGTIRDRDFNIIFYEPKLDKYHTSNRDV